MTVKRIMDVVEEEYESREYFGWIRLLAHPGQCPT